MKIGIDVMSGDNAPCAVIDAVVEFIKHFENDQLVLFGDSERINALCKIKIQDIDRIEFVECKEVINYEDEPVKAIKTKKDSTLVKGFEYLRDGLIDAFVSAGNTGALLAGGILIVGRIKGVDRPALATLIPTKNKEFLLIDAGSNTECKPINLLQFAQMASIYMEKINGVKKPSVGLLNIGVEENKGNKLTKEAYTLLKETKSINFIGNFESREIPFNPPDVLVCDGFIGNIVLKLIEGMGLFLFDTLKEVANTNSKTKIGGLLLKSELKKFKNKFDYQEIGGAPLLGVNGAVFKCHGSSNWVAFYNGLRQLKMFCDNNVLEIFRNEIIAEREV